MTTGIAAEGSICGRSVPTQAATPMRLILEIICTFYMIGSMILSLWHYFPAK